MMENVILNENNPTMEILISWEYQKNTDRGLRSSFFSQRTLVFRWSTARRRYADLRQDPPGGKSARPCPPRPLCPLRVSARDRHTVYFLFPGGRAHFPHLMDKSSLLCITCSGQAEPNMKESWCLQSLLESKSRPAGLARGLRTHRHHLSIAACVRGQR